MERCVLIDNFRQESLMFENIAAMRRYIKENNLQVREQRTFHPIRSFYTESI